MDKAQRTTDVHLSLLVQRAQDALDRSDLAAASKQRLDEDLGGFGRDHLPRPYNPIE